MSNQNRMELVQAGQSSFPLVVKKSKFITSASPVHSIQEALDFLLRIQAQHKKASHHCYAYRILTKDSSGEIIQKIEDDGEPSGTAGKPIIYVLEKQEIVNTIIIVTRYFGGAKLGKGGLVRAYSKSASTIIQAIGLKEYKKSN
ncbi:MAG: IMPACT family protein [Promethearchaeota archaeon]